ncbi:MAG: TMEM175 family protein [Thermoanaerobaculia bacterium]
MSDESRPRADSGSARLEAFSDAVFGFAATLLVVALEVPSTFAELEGVLRGFAPFSLSFGTLILIWSVHHAFFRRFPMTDRVTVALNSCLLFVVLFYVYPLKFLARSIAAMFLGSGVAGGATIASLAELGRLFAWYGAGFAALFLCFVLLYAHGARRAGALGLPAQARDEAIFLARHYAIFVFVAGLSIVLALTGIGLTVALPGWIYSLIGPLCGVHGAWHARHRAATGRR